MCMVPQCAEMSLDEYTTRELIDAIARRPTFAGMIIYSHDNHKFPDQKHPNFELLTSLDNDSSVYMLQKMIEVVRNAKEG